MLILLIAVLLVGIGVTVFAVMNADKDGAPVEPAKPATPAAPKPPQPVPIINPEPQRPAMAAVVEPPRQMLLSEGPTPEHSHEKISYKEAIAHGWDMTRKYWLPLLMVTIIYVIFQVLGGVLQSQVGRSHMSRFEVAAVYKDRARADRFYLYLQQAGYINKSGFVQSRLQDLTNPADLALSSDFADKRTEISNFLNSYRYRLPFPRPVFYLFSFGLWLLGIVMMAGYTKVSLLAARDEQPSVPELFNNWNRVIPLLLGGLCYGLVVLGGFILLIIPGIIFMIMFQMYMYLIIDKGLGPIASLKRSRVITKGNRGRLGVLGLLLILVNLAGFLCLVVGLFLTIWTSAIAMAYVYDRLEHDFSPQT